MSFPTTRLKDRAVVAVVGPDAATLLQGLITKDIAKVAEGRAIYAALLTPQGKIIHDFVISGTSGGFNLDCAKPHAADLAARLGRYKLRAKVKIAERSDLAVVVSSEPTAGAFPDPRLPALGFRAIQANVDFAGDETAYHTHRIALGVPDSADIPPETLFPLDCNFEELHGVDFDKGCYVGQELTARMKHRASARRRMLPVDADTALPPAATPLKIGATDVGELRGSIGARGIALVRLDRMGDAREALAGDVTVRIHRPAYPLILPAGDQA